MEQQMELPLLLELLFGEGATMSVASVRLLAWCRAFEEWLAEKHRSHCARKNRCDLAPWRLLLRQSDGLGRRPKMPWELERADIEAHVAWLQAEGYAPNTVSLAIGSISSFYRWCGERGVDPACRPGFNPAAGVPRPVVKPWQRSRLLSSSEVGALLGILWRDRTPLGRRDYAFFLARLCTGVPLAELRCLRWGQIEAGGGEGRQRPSLGLGCRVRWRPEGQPFPLPEGVWGAVTAYLVASGRLAGMRAETYIFAPLVNSAVETAGSVPQDWIEGRPVSREALMVSLKMYGRAVEIPEDKLTMNALRRTAIRLQLDAGEGLEGMQVFLDSRGEPRLTQYRLRTLPGLPEGEQVGGAGVQEPAAQLRPGRLPNAGRPVLHGFYAENLPSEEVLAVLAEDIQGLDEQICGLRTLARGLLFWQGDDLPPGTLLRVDEAYAVAARRLAELIKVDKKIETKLAESGEKNEWADEFLARIDAMYLEQGLEPISQEVREEALGFRPELSIAARHMVEEAATLRCKLRRTLRAAMEAQEVELYLRMLEVYGRLSHILAQILIAGGTSQGSLADYIQQTIAEALDEVIQELGIE